MVPKNLLHLKHNFQYYSYFFMWMWTKIFVNESDRQPNQNFADDEKRFSTVIC
jgi:hypothetical protein